jgi:Ca-activated chloride channel family protein
MNPFDPQKTITPGAEERTIVTGPDPGRTQMGGPGAGFTLEVRPENGSLLATEPSRNHLLIQWRATGAGISTGVRRPLNLALAIDRSGSMEGEPLQYAKDACCRIIDLLDANDVLTIVTFAETVETLVPARRVVNRQMLKDLVSRIGPGNTTDLHGGMVTAANHVAAVGGGYVNRVLLLTDGDPTTGVKDFPSIVGAAAEQKSRGITVSALGFGPDYNEELLDGIARRNGGNYYYISRPELLPEVFRAELMTMMSLAATNARLRIRPAKWNRVRQIYGHRLEFTADAVETELADLEQGTALTLLAEMDFGERPAGRYRGAVVEVEYEDVATGAAGRLSADAVWTFTADPAEVAASADAGVAAELQVAMASQLLERTLMGMRTQQIDNRTAILELERTQQILLSSGRTAEAAEVTQALEKLQAGDANAAGKTLTGATIDLGRGKKAQTNG